MTDHFDHITRLHVIPDQSVDHPCHPKEYWADSWVVALQDEGCTLKLFGRGNGHRSRGLRDQDLAGKLEHHRWWQIHKRRQRNGY